MVHEHVFRPSPAEKLQRTGKKTKGLKRLFWLLNLHVFTTLKSYPNRERVVDPLLQCHLWPKVNCCGGTVYNCWSESSFAPSLNFNWEWLRENPVAPHLASFVSLRFRMSGKCTHIIVVRLKASMAWLDRKTRLLAAGSAWWLVIKTFLTQASDYRTSWSVSAGQVLWVHAGQWSVLATISIHCVCGIINIRWLKFLLLFWHRNWAWIGFTSSHCEHSHWTNG